MKRRTENGFSLIELMITVAIIGILASIAIPSYQDSVRKGKRAEGRAALVNLLQQQERYLGQRGTYAAFTNGTGDGANFKVFSGDKSEGASYLLTAETCPSPNDSLKTCVLLTAVSQFTDTEAGNLTMTSFGTKSCTGSKTSVCWK
mgnify:CR=1 FL=1|jgi:type IV pilus assembly protein PilE